MSSLLLLLASLSATSGPPLALPSAALTATDTTVVLRPGDRVVVSGLSGSVSAEGVDTETLRVTTGRRTDEVVVRRSGGRVLVTTEGRDRARPMDVSLRLPRWAELEVEGVDLDVTVAGLEAAASVDVVTGDIRAAGTGGTVRLSTIEGEVTAEAPRGPIHVSAHTDDIVVLDARGDVEAVSLDGDIRIENASSMVVRAETQSGDIVYSGAVGIGGRYTFRLHSGDALLTLPPTLNARVRVSTFHGDFQSDFPVVVSDFMSGRAFEFTVGRADAEIVVEVFDGEVRLLRGGQR